MLHFEFAVLRTEGVLRVRFPVFNPSDRSNFWVRRVAGPLPRFRPRIRLHQPPQQLQRRLRPRGQQLPLCRSLRAGGPLRGGANQARRQPSLHRRLRREGPRQLHHFCQVGWRTCAGFALPHHRVILSDKVCLDVRFCLCDFAILMRFKFARKNEKISCSLKTHFALRKRSFDEP